MPAALLCTLSGKQSLVTGGGLRRNREGQVRGCVGNMEEEMKRRATQGDEIWKKKLDEGKERRREIEREGGGGEGGERRSRGKRSKGKRGQGEKEREGNERGRRGER